MNKIVNKLKSLMGLLANTRQTGQTTLLNKIAKNEDVYIVVHNHQMKELFNRNNQKKIISISELDKLRGAKPKPFLIDNALLYQIIHDSQEKIDNQSYIISNYRKTINVITDEITDLNNRCNIRE